MRLQLKLADMSPAPNYRPSEDPNRVCDNCAFNEPSQNYCTRYNFKDEPTYVCDDWQTLNLNLDALKTGSTRNKVSRGHVIKTAATPSVGAQPIKPLAPAGGRPPQQMPKPPQPGQPNFQQMQPNPTSWRPSAVAGVAASKGDPSAWIMNLFKPQAPQAPQAPMKAASALGLALLREQAKKPPLLSIKIAARHAFGDKLPKDWNMTVPEPNKTNGGIGSYGREAWDSVKGYRRSSADNNTFDRAWHTEKGKEKK